MPVPPRETELLGCPAGALSLIDVKGEVVSSSQPGDPSLRKAIRFVSESLGEDEPDPLLDIVGRATLRFDLNPNQAEYLVRFYRVARDEGGGVSSSE